MLSFHCNQFHFNAFWLGNLSIHQLWFDTIQGVIIHTRNWRNIRKPLFRQHFSNSSIKQFGRSDMDKRRLKISSNETNYRLSLEFLPLAGNDLQKTASQGVVFFFFLLGDDIDDYYWLFGIQLVFFG